MSALNYTVFVDKVEDGSKRQTIRAMRKRPIKVGERLYHFTGARTKACRRLRAQHEDFCLSAEDIQIEFFPAQPKEPLVWMKLWINGSQFAHIDEIARADGFDDGNDFATYFRKAAKPRSPRDKTSHFYGQLVAW